MEPKYYAFRRWLYTPIILWQGDWIPRDTQNTLRLKTRHDGVGLFLAQGLGELNLSTGTSPTYHPSSWHSKGICSAFKYPEGQFTNSWFAEMFLQLTYLFGFGTIYIYMITLQTWFCGRKKTVEKMELQIWSCLWWSTMSCPGQTSCLFVSFPWLQFPWFFSMCLAFLTYTGMDGFAGRSHRDTTFPWTCLRWLFTFQDGKSPVKHDVMGNMLDLSPPSRIHRQDYHIFK